MVGLKCLRDRGPCRFANTGNVPNIRMNLEQNRIAEAAIRLGREQDKLILLLNGKAGVTKNMAHALESLGW